MGKSQKTNTTQSSTQTSRVDPRYENAAYDAYGQAQQVAGNYQPLTLPNMPTLNADQQAYQDRVRSMQGQSTLGPLSAQYGQYQNYQPLQVSAGNVSAPSAYTPQGATAATATASLTNRGDIRDVANQNVNAAQFSPEALQAVLAGLDPSYTNAVRDTTLQDINRSRQLAQLPNADAAARQGAFGGSRQGILEAETNRAYGDIAARTAADLNLNYFNTALGTLQTDLERQQQAGMFNSDAALRAALANQGIDANVALNNSQLGTQTSIANAGNRTQAGIASAGFANQAAMAAQDNALRAALANQNAGLTAGLANQDAGFRAADLGLRATDRLTDLNSIQRNRDLQDLDLLNSIGNQNYDIALGQNAIDYQNAQNRQQAPLTQLGIMQSGLNYLPQNMTTTGAGQSTQQTSMGGFGTYLGGALQLGSLFLPGGGASGIFNRNPGAPSRNGGIIGLEL